MHGIAFCFAVGGSPITHVAEQAAALLAGFEWSINEKVAVENALGLSFTGSRSAVMFKQNGLNVALDPLMNASLHGIGAALLVIVADDLDCSRSTALQDSRDLAALMRIPLIEPTLEADLDRCVAAAIELSEAESVPVVLRLTGPVPPGARTPRFAPAEPAATPRTVDPFVALQLTKLGRVQHRRLRSARGRTPAGAAHDIVCVQPHGPGIVAFGHAATAVPPEVVACRLVMRSLANEAVQDEQTAEFLERHDPLLVVEEPLPHLERWIRQRLGVGRQAIGRLSGHLPPEGPVAGPAIAAALATEPRRWTDVATRSEKDRTYPPYDRLFHAVADLRHSGVFVAVDVGSSVYLCFPPYSASDVAVSIGSAISVAAGAARRGTPSVAVIGDYAFLHTGLQSLIDVTMRNLPVLVVVMVNGIQDKTGGQPLAPGVNDGKQSDAMISRIVQGISHGIRIERWDSARLARRDFLDRMSTVLRSAPAVALVTPA